MTEHISGKNQGKSRQDLLQRLLEQIILVGKQMHHRVESRSPSLSQPHARLLFAIASKKEAGISVKELAEKTGVTPGAITQFVDALVEKQLVKRREDPNDRRIVRLTLTKTAKDQFGKLRKDFLSSATRMFTILTDDEIETLIGLLAKVSSDTNQDERKSVSYIKTKFRSFH